MMRRVCVSWMMCIAVAVLALAMPMYAQASDSIGPSAAWQPPKAEQVKAQTLGWLDAQKVDEAASAKAQTLWSDVSERAPDDQLLLRVVRTLALGDSRAATLVAMCSEPRSHLMVSAQPWLMDRSLPKLFTANLRLMYGCWLVHESLYDEAQEQLAGLAPGDVAAPASLLFYQSAVSHALLNKESGLKSIEELLQGADASPRRYIAMAKMMQEDLKGLQDDTLDHIARRMDDIRRRLDLGRAGPKVRKQEDGVVESLDKLIKKIEKEQQSQESSGNADSIRSNSPASDSQPLGGKGPGEVTKKNIGAESGWGDLPPKEREEAMQQIGRDFPSHYRDVVEQYFRRLAGEGDERRTTNDRR